ncbi:helix-turn-helix domain-containing protein [Echinicola vietnamensis]|uniref:DNA-binding domain-containing protein, AraC-type n=1 Tax=Echinicola vietnamensis (strain DSM 17526 / LMG 23754 / KMM 6221) TaxID=926556 RepID=L0FZJ9_ECHVK|nr:helix-turn-helix domain-containing protein [Echinicola vietnamensis]AGA78732.1 DNA-binding domain-containing protein, AraC-type [Echinicola vietnamensis DSM 17526]
MGIMLTVVILQALTSGLLIYLNKRYKGEDLYLSLLFGIIAIHVSYKALLYWLVDDMEVFDKLHGCFSLLYGPLLYFYVQSIRNRPISSAQIIVHASPFFIGFGLNIMMVMLLMIQETSALIMELYHQGVIISVFVSFSAYSLYSLYLLHHTSNNNAIYRQKATIARLIAACNLLLSFLVVFGWVMLIWDVQFPVSTRYIYYFLMLALFYSIIHIRTRMLLHAKPSETTFPKISIQAQEKYRNSKVSEEELATILDQINKVFKDKKPYLNPDFNLDQLAKELDTTKLKITQALNLHLGQNFYQYVNSARIEESKNLLQQPNEDNLTVVGYESGFKSKSTFYKYFKEATGCSPSDYKKSLQVNG